MCSSLLRRCLIIQFCDWELDSLFFFFFFKTTWDFGYICRYFQANGKGWAITGVEMLLEVCDASIREMDDRDTGDRSIEFQ